MTERVCLPRVMFAAPSSGSGKTMITCAILEAFRERGLRPVSFKCGPDYIDPLFHEKATGVPSCNLDLFFAGSEVRQLYARRAEKYDVSVLEGVMGFYDGCSGTNGEASSYELARITDTPVILIVDARGMSLSLIPLIQGFLRYPKEAALGPNMIQGVILNRAKESTCRMLRDEIEKQTGVRVYGYFPESKEAKIESRHLGLLLPDELSDLRQRMHSLGEQAEHCLDLDGILALCRGAEDVTIPDFAGGPASAGRDVRIAVAKDEAFCFYYRDNLDLIRDGCREMVFFSPLHDQKLPEGIGGLILGGGYPELYAGQLSGNSPMRESVRSAVADGLPYLAECGGFLYLHETMEDMQGQIWPMCGCIPEKAYRTETLGHFGYAEIRGCRPDGILTDQDVIRGHEYHYYESTDGGDCCEAIKPGGKKKWPCMYVTDHSAAGFPHLYYRSDPNLIARFLDCADRYTTRIRQGGTA